MNDTCHISYARLLITADLQRSGPSWLSADIVNTEIFDLVIHNTITMYFHACADRHGPLMVMRMVRQILHTLKRLSWCTAAKLVHPRTSCKRLAWAASANRQPVHVTKCMVCYDIKPTGRRLVSDCFHFDARQSMQDVIKGLGALFRRHARRPGICTDPCCHMLSTSTIPGTAISAPGQDLAMMDLSSELHHAGDSFAASAQVGTAVPRRFRLRVCGTQELPAMHLIQTFRSGTHKSRLQHTADVTIGAGS